jgi:hypothetical protein
MPSDPVPQDPAASPATLGSSTPPAGPALGDDGLVDPVLEDLAEQRIAERGER